MSSSVKSARLSRERLAGYGEEMLGRRIVLLGAGALGDALAVQLAMWGFSRALIVDCDSYEMSNAARVLDFPYARVRAGEIVWKAEDVASRWRTRLDAAGIAPNDVRGEVGFAQEVDPKAWRDADVVVAALDHPRARLDAARLARRYGKPIVLGGFDAVSQSVTIEIYPAAVDAACLRCTLATEPSYAASSASCTAVGLRAHEAREIPATPTLAAACASVMVQRIVDGLTHGFPSGAETTQLSIGSRSAILERRSL